MIKSDIPGYGVLELKHLVLDYNGTLAVDGFIEDGVVSILNHISNKIDVHVITADTFGKAKEELKKINCKLTLLNNKHQKEAKLEFISKLNPNHVVSCGNGRNDSLMLKKSRLGISVLLSEGLAVETMIASDIVCKNITSALKLLLNPMRLIATLRS